MTRLAEDYALILAAAVITASAVVLGGFLLRYREMAREVDSSTKLAKDVWDSVSARFSVLDARIIDVMAKTEVLSTRMTPRQATPRQEAVVESAPGAQVPGSVTTKVVRPDVEGTDTELRVLRLLAQGPRTSAQIKEEVGRSREHTARLMKGLFDRGLVVRNDRNRPYLYEITERGRSYVTS